MASILVLARSNAAEAKRVAAGITIMGHDVRLVVITARRPDPEEAAVQGRNLSLAGITPETTRPELAGAMTLIARTELAAAIQAADHVLCL